MATTIGTLEIEMAANIARLSADLGAARNEVNRTMGEIQRSVSSMQDGIQSGMNGVTAAFGKVNVAIAAITTALAGGAAFKSAVEETVNMTKEANALGKSLGISATEASILNIALGDIYQSSDTMLAANKAMTKQLVSNEDAFKSLGVATRDQNGHYRNSLDIMLDVNGRLLAFDKTGVTFRYKDYRRDGAGRQQVMTLGTNEFIRRFLLHVLPRGFQKVRAYGWLAPRRKAGAIAAIRACLGVRPPQPPPADETMTERILRLTGVDVSRCPVCGTGHLICVGELPRSRDGPA